MAGPRGKRQTYGRDFLPVPEHDLGLSRCRPMPEGLLPAVLPAGQDVGRGEHHQSVGAGKREQHGGVHPPRAGTDGARQGSDASGSAPHQTRTVATGAADGRNDLRGDGLSARGRACGGSEHGSDSFRSGRPAFNAGVA